MVEVRLTGVSKKYDDVPAVQNLSLTVKDKEFLTVLGPSGGGKSTTLRLIAGLETPTEGEIYLNQKQVNEVPPQDRNMTMVFQNYALFPHMTARDNITFPLTIRKTPRSEVDSRLQEVTKLLKITHLLDRKPGELSGGEQQRVALGRAIIRKPDVFLMDEPLSNLDASLRAEMRTELKRLQKELQTTLVYVTHDQTEAMSMADRIAVIKDGGLLQLGTPDEIYNNPATAWIGSFIGNPPMNLIDCTVSDDGKLILAGGACTLDIPNSLSSKTGKLRKGSRLKLGVRPEDIEIQEQPSDLSCQAEVYLLESLGDSVLVDFKLGEVIVKVKTKAGYEVKIGKNGYLKFNETKIILFDSKTDKSLSYSGDTTDS